VTRSIGTVTAVIVMAAVVTTTSWSAEQRQIDKTSVETQREPTYQGEPLSHWLKSIRDRDDKIVLAFDAIRDLGPDAWPAVEELTRIVALSFRHKTQAQFSALPPFLQNEFSAIHSRVSEPDNDRDLSAIRFGMRLRRTQP
jgi:hypothetical protein